MKQRTLFAEVQSIFRVFRRAWIVARRNLFFALFHYNCKSRVEIVWRLSHWCLVPFAAANANRAHRLCQECHLKLSLQASLNPPLVYSLSAQFVNESCSATRIAPGLPAARDTFRSKSRALKRRREPWFRTNIHRSCVQRASNDVVTGLAMVAAGVKDNGCSQTPRNTQCRNQVACPSPQPPCTPVVVSHRKRPYK